jgi:NhaP-type Na+/H+ or K+/H+ antiporter
MLLNVSIFLWFGAVCPWSDFVNTPDLPFGRLVLLGILILLLRRPPIIFALYRWVPRIESFREALFAGYFGPIGVSAIFYLFVTCEYLNEIDQTPGLPDSGRKEVEEMLVVVRLVVWMCVVISVIVHGITIPFIMVSSA